MLRTCCVLAVLLALPALAADVSEAIHFQHVPVSEVESFILGKPVNGQAPGSIMGPGISAWTIDPVRNSLVLTGKAPALKAFRDQVLLLDLPARRMEISVRVVHVPDEIFDPLKPALKNSGPEKTAFTLLGTVRGNLRSALDLLPTAAGGEITATSGHAIHLRYPVNNDENPPHLVLTLVPRVHADGGVVFTVAQEGIEPPAAAKKGEESRTVEIPLFLAPKSPVSLPKLADGEMAVAMPEAGGMALVIHLKRVLADEPVRRAASAPGSG